jgi:hypothetical protein
VTEVISLAVIGYAARMGFARERSAAWRSIWKPNA